MGETLLLDTPLRALRGVGPRREAALGHVGLETVEDLLLRLPIRYEDRSAFKPVAEICEGEKVTVSGELINCRLRWTGRRGFKVFEAVVRDSSGCLPAVWPNQPFRQNTLHAHQLVVLHGTAARYRGVLQLQNPDVETLEDSRGESAHAVHTGRIVPVYERAGVMAPRMQRALVHEVLTRLPERVEDLLPAELRARRSLPGRRDALSEAHLPPSGTPVDDLNRFRTPAQVRLIFEEFFLFQFGVRLRQHEAARQAKPCISVVDDRIRAAVRAALPFRLTAGQAGALRDIVGDLQNSGQMNRLLQGDVGSGKTIVALVAALVVVENGHQAALMAPTEILAEQHSATATRFFQPTG